MTDSLMKMLEKSAFYGDKIEHYSLIKEELENKLEEANKSLKMWQTIDEKLIEKINKLDKKIDWK